jgi:L-threonylcarbamoyladenylate synthase
MTFSLKEVENMLEYETKYWIVDKSHAQLTVYPQILDAAMWIKRNETVAFPTETVYGLGANALSEAAVAKIFEAKGRPSDNPLIIHIHKQEQLTELVSFVPETAKKLMDTFWPGPITFVLRKHGDVPRSVTAGLSTVAVRMPDHPVALALLEASNLPIAAPSANLSGKPSPTAAEHVLQDLNGRVAGIIDGGPTGIGIESTVLDCTTEIPLILRPGGVTKEELEAVVGQINVDGALLGEGTAPRSPGMKYKHYAPEAPFILVEGSALFLQQLVTKAKMEGKRVGVLTTEENKSLYQADVLLTAGWRSDLGTVTSAIYDVLRTFNTYDVDIIFSESFPRVGVGVALMNRLQKAANGQIVRR